MTDCTHRKIVAFSDEDGPVPLWACSDCGARFAPIDREATLETALSDCLRHMHTAGDPRAVEAADAARELLGVER